MSSSGEEQKTPLKGSQNSGQPQQNKDSTKDSGTIEEVKQSETQFSDLSQSLTAEHISVDPEHGVYDNIRHLEALKIKDQTNANGGMSTLSKPEENISQHK